jgi:WD40 repeat protein
VNHVAVACSSGKIHVYNFASGNLLCELYEENADLETVFMAVVSEWFGVVKQEEVRNVVDGVWLVAGHRDGTVRIWVVETECCVGTFHPMVSTQDSASRFTIACGGSRVLNFTEPYGADSPE